MASTANKGNNKHSSASKGNSGMQRHCRNNEIDSELSSHRLLILKCEEHHSSLIWVFYFDMRPDCSLEHIQPIIQWLCLNSHCHFLFSKTSMQLVQRWVSIRQLFITCFSKICNDTAHYWSWQITLFWICCTDAYEDRRKKMSDCISWWSNIQQDGNRHK
jgi:hypothetical protein